MRGRLRIEASTLAWIGLAALLLFTAAVVLRETRDTTLWGDDIGWALDRRSGSLLRPHNGHFSLIPLLLYRALFATAGLTDYLPYRVMITAEIATKTASVRRLNVSQRCRGSGRDADAAIIGTGVIIA